jgi:hypothetical protein
MHTEKFVGRETQKILRVIPLYQAPGRCNEVVVSTRTTVAADGANKKSSVYRPFPGASPQI